MPSSHHDPVTFEVLQANVQLLAEKERLEQERQRLLDLDQIKNEFLARISHDLRTPLSSIIGFSDLLLTGEGGKINRKHLEFIQAINRNGHTLLALINDLLDLSTIESGQIQLKRQSEALTGIFEDLRAATSPVLAQARLTTIWPEPAVLVGQVAMVDRRRIVQVLVNLVDNARKFTPAGGTVTIGCIPGGSQTVFTVTDTGPGIPTMERERLFQPFARHGSIPSGRGEGAGLGLVIVKAIVDRHQGSIVVGGETGKGCSFTITIPQPA